MRTDLLLAAALLVACASVALAQKGAPRFSLSIQTDHDAYEVGETIRLKVTVTNITANDIVVPARDAYVYRIVAADAKGNAVAQIPPKKEARIDATHVAVEVRLGSGLLATLKPKESLTDDLNASAVLDFSKPGKYVVRVLSAVPDDAGRPAAASNVINISVTSSPPK